MVLLIAGPTASGKSALALALAEAVGGEIINADSQQVYRELRILTARPTVTEEARVPHHLYGFVGVREGFSVGSWLRCAQGVLDDIRARGTRAIFVGGTGLYFHALGGGLARIPPIPEAVRVPLRRRLAQEGPQELYEELLRVDKPLALSLPPADGQRIVRGLEVFQATGMPLSLWQKGALLKPPLAPPVEAVKCALLPDRSWRAERIRKRLEEMVEAGVLEEVRALLPLNPHLPALKIHGLLPLAAYVRGEQSLEAALEETAITIRRYAKRQETWIRNRMRDWHILREQDTQSLKERVLSFINGTSC